MLFWRYCKDMQTSYFWYFGHAWLHTPKNILVQDFDVYLLPKINFIIHFFLEILQFKESCNLIGWQDFEFSKKKKNNLFWGRFGHFCPNMVKNKFPWKNALSVFRYSNYLPSCQKSEKKHWAISEKNAELTDGQTDRRIDRQL